MSSVHMIDMIVGDEQDAIGSRYFMAALLLSFTTIL
jgi:hypothetical protein